MKYLSDPGMDLEALYKLFSYLIAAYIGKIIFVWIVITIIKCMILEHVIKKAIQKTISKNMIYIAEKTDLIQRRTDAVISKLSVIIENQNDLLENNYATEAYETETTEENWQ